MSSVPEPPLYGHELAAQAVLDIARLGYAIPSLTWLSGKGFREPPVGGSGVAGGAKKEPAFLRVAACEVFGTTLKVCAHSDSILLCFPQGWIIYATTLGIPFL